MPGHAVADETDVKYETTGPSGASGPTAPSATHLIPSVTEYVAAEIARRISSGELAPGQRVQEEAIAREFGISRSPIREAFSLLEAAGLLTKRPRRGVVVTEFTLTDVWEVYTLQKALYNLGIELSRDAFTGDNLKLLASLVSEMEAALAKQPPDVVGYQDLNRRFHILPIQLSGHRRLLELSESLAAQVTRFSARSLGVDQIHLARSLTYHRKIFAALKKRDIEVAQRLVGEHIDQALLVLEAQLGTS
jgi:DNA-binding GntR family transcriptional regulator